MSGDLGGQFLLADRDHVAAVAGADEVRDQEDGGDIHQEDDPDVLGIAGGAQRPAAGAAEALYVVEHEAHGLPEPEGGDAEVVALEVEGDPAHKPADQPRGGPAAEDADHERHPEARDVPRGGYRDKGPHVGAYGHEARVPEGEKSRETREEGKTQHGHEVDAGQLSIPRM